jgi:hypothetical protein
MFVVKAGAYTRLEHLKGASLGKAPALPANISLGWKDLSETNSLLQKSVNYDRKKVL